MRRPLELVGCQAGRKRTLAERGDGGTARALEALPAYVPHTREPNDVGAAKVKARPLAHRGRGGRTVEALGPLPGGAWAPGKITTMLIKPAGQTLSVEN
jgi:hypothetical protein